MRFLEERKQQSLIDAGGYTAPTLDTRFLSYMNVRACGLKQYHLICNELPVWWGVFKELGIAEHIVVTGSTRFQFAFHYVKCVARLNEYMRPARSTQPPSSGEGGGGA